MGDYHGDRHDDFVIWRPSNGTWWAKYTSGGVWQNEPWGVLSDVPV